MQLNHRCRTKHLIDRAKYRINNIYNSLVCRAGSLPSSNALLCHPKKSQQHFRWLSRNNREKFLRLSCFLSTFRPAISLWHSRIFLFSFFFLSNHCRAHNAFKQRSRNNRRGIWIRCSVSFQIFWYALFGKLNEKQIFVHRCLRGDFFFCRRRRNVVLRII